MIKLKFAPNLLFQRLPDDNASMKTKNDSENNVNIEEQKIGQYSFAEGLWKDLTSATFRQFYNRLQLKLSVNSLKKKFLSCCLIIWAVIGYKSVYMFHYLDLFKEPQQKNTVQFSVAWFSNIFKVVFIFLFALSSGKGL